MRILLVGARPPWPPYRGDQLRLRQWIEALSPEHEVRVLCPTPGPNAPARWASVCEGGWPERSGARHLTEAAAGWLGGLPAQVALYRSTALSHRVTEAARKHDRTVILLARLAPLLDDIPAETAILDLVDCLSLSTARRARFGPSWQRPFWSLEARRLQRVEHRALRRCARALVVSPRDRGALLPRAGSTPIEVVPVAFPGETDEHDESEGASLDAAAPCIAFTGNLGYWVNRDALRWWGERVWPGLHRRRPELRWLVAGRRPSGSLARFLERRGAELVRDPPDLRHVLRSCSLAIAPLRGGAGQPLKVLDAWAARIPIVVSPWTAAGLGRPDGVVVAETATEWSAAIESLLDSETRRRELVATGARRLADAWSWDRVAPELRRAVE